jgi:hypothetical protein
MSIAPLFFRACIGDIAKILLCLWVSSLCHKQRLYPMTQDEIDTRRAEIHTKMRGLIKELSEGKISTEQFNVLYERYQNLLELLSADELAVEANDLPTVAYRNATTAKAIGMSVYHHRSGIMIETLGNFDVSPATLAPVLNEILDKRERREFIEPKVQKVGMGIYMVFMVRQYTTVIILFRNEPAQAQLRDVERLQHDFEEANRHLLESNAVDGSKLAKPFLGFVRKKIGS